MQRWLVGVATPSVSPKLGWMTTGKASNEMGGTHMTSRVENTSLLARATTYAVYLVILNNALELCTTTVGASLLLLLANENARGLGGSGGLCVVVGIAVGVAGGGRVPALLIRIGANDAVHTRPFAPSSIRSGRHYGLVLARSARHATAVRVCSVEKGASVWGGHGNTGTGTSASTSASSTATSRGCRRDGRYARREGRHGALEHMVFCHG
jgi:hypothetical protein